MRYRKGIWIPAGKTKDDPSSVMLDIAPGVITQVEITFPAGHSGLTNVQVYYHERQIFPTTPGVAFRGDDTLISFNESWAIREVPHQLEIRGWAPLSVYGHTVFVAVSVLEDTSYDDAFGVLVPLPEGFI